MYFCEPLQIFYSLSKRFLYESIFNLSGSWHFHQKLTRCSLNRSTGLIQSSSQSVRLLVEEVYHIPSFCPF